MNIYGLNIETYENINTETKLLNFVYAHCDLDNLNEFDLVGMNKYVARRFEKHKPDGIYDVDFYCNNSTEPIKAKLYWWHDKDGFQHGLVCSIDDSDGNADALNKYNERREHCSGWTL